MRARRPSSRRQRRATNNSRVARRASTAPPSRGKRRVGPQWSRLISSRSLVVGWSGRREDGRPEQGEVRDMMDRRPARNRAHEQVRDHMMRRCACALSGSFLFFLPVHGRSWAAAAAGWSNARCVVYHTATMILPLPLPAAPIGRPTPGSLASRSRPRRASYRTLL